MAEVLSLSLCLVLLSTGFSVLGCSITLKCTESTTKTCISARFGDNVTLPCQGPKDSKMRVLEWSKSEHQQLYVFMYRDEQIDLENQDQSFMNRVELKDKEMKDGDVSLNLNHVTSNDSGTYECRVSHKSRTNLHTEPINIIHLDVTSNGEAKGGQRDGKVQEHGLIVCQFLFLLYSLL